MANPLIRDATSAGPAGRPLKTGTATPSARTASRSPRRPPLRCPPPALPRAPPPRDRPHSILSSGRQARDFGPAIATGLKETA